MKISNKEKIRILSLYKPEQIWKFNEEKLKEIGITENYITEILDDNNKIKLEKYLNYMEKNKIELIYFYDENYPKKLINIGNFPAFIYLRGNVQNLYGDNIAIVGSRDASYYGISIAKKISKELADKNINIVSGLAIRN